MLDIQTCKAMIQHLEEIKKILEIEEPTPIFVFEVEAKIRAYKRKLIKILEAKHHAKV